MASVDSAPTPLHGRPGRRTSLVGRETAIRSLTELLARSDVRLVTLTGPGGIGKTRLAEQVLDRLPNAFPGAAAFIDLSPVQSPDLVLAAIAQSTGVPDDPGRPLLARTLDFLAGHRALLVIDNVEHVHAAMVPVAIDLLDGCPTLTILATSRIPLDISGERVVPVPPLDAASAREMFLDRATARSSGLDIATDQHTIDAICARLDGLPLAIELAAAHTPVLPPRALLARLERSLPLLANGPHDAPARQRSMRDTIAWSHDLLTERQRTVMRRLGVFVGGFTLDAATAVANDGEDCLPEISALVAASLVRPIPGVGDDARFTMLETIREYALERLHESGEEDAIRTRHARYFQELVEESLPHLDGPGLRLWSSRVGREVDNHRAAMEWALEHDEAEIGTRLAGALWRMWTGNLAAQSRAWAESVTEGLAWCERMLARWPEQPAMVMCEALVGASHLSALLGDPDRPRSAAMTLLARSTAEDYAYGAWWAHELLGELDMGFRHHAMTGLQGFDAGPFDMGLPSSERSLWTFDLDLPAARRHFEAALAIAPTIRNPENHAAMALASLATCAWRSGDLDDAGLRYSEAVSLSRTTGNPLILASILAAYGGLLHATGQARQAVACLAESADLTSEWIDAPMVRLSMARLADIALAAGQNDLAARLLGVADGSFTVLPTFALHEQSIARASSALGRQRFDEERQRGRQLSRTELHAELDALETALGEVPAQPASHGLTRRELDVLTILTEGCSNRAIADRLSLSERTVENHVLHILTKLDLDSRTAAAAWAVRNGLA